MEHHMNNDTIKKLDTLQICDLSDSIQGVMDDFQVILDFVAQISHNEELPEDVFHHAFSDYAIERRTQLYEYVTQLEESLQNHLYIKEKSV